MSDVETTIKSLKKLADDLNIHFNSVKENNKKEKAELEDKIENTFNKKLISLDTKISNEIRLMDEKLLKFCKQKTMIPLKMQEGRVL